MYQSLIIILRFIGITAVIAGFTYRLFPKQKSNYRQGITNKINNLALSKPLKSILNIFFGNKTNFFHRTSTRLLTVSESSLSIHGLLLTKQAVIAKPSTAISIFTGQAATDYARNVELYIAVLKDIDKENLQKLDDVKILENAQRVLPKIIKTSDLNIVKEHAAIFFATFKEVNSISFFDYWSLVIILFSFWLPEAFLLSKRLLLTSIYRKEVIKLENIFELLGSVQGIKTFDILMEMAKASVVYRKHLTICMERFNIEK